jgi:glucosylceramidase
MKVLFMVSLIIFLERVSTYLTFQTDYQTNVQYTINVDSNIRYQQMDGFGASLTDASAWLFRNKLSTTVYADTLSKLFTSIGINLSLLRQPIGSSDFNWEAWTFDDTTNNQDDFSLGSFSLWREDAYIRPVLDQILFISQKRLKLIGSPWSPPAWMKTRKHLNGNIGGILRADCYDTYADYIVKYLKSYEAKGSKVYGITVQNEPQYAPAYPGMLMSSSEQIKFIAYHLGPKLNASSLGTKIIGFDHNYDPQGLQYAEELLSNSEANKYVSGIGFHTYTTPNHLGMNNLRNKYPNKDFWITEAGSGTWIGTFLL